MLSYLSLVIPRDCPSFRFFISRLRIHRPFPNFIRHKGSLCEAPRSLMAQRSILSFFGNKPDSAKPSKKKSPIKVSPVRVKKRRVFIESDESSVESCVPSSPMVIKMSPTKTTEPQDAQESTLQPKSEALQDVGNLVSSCVQKNVPIVLSPSMGIKAITKTKNQLNPEDHNVSKADSVLQSKFQYIDNYDPSVDAYDPVASACWKRGERVPYIAFAKTLEIIEGTSSRLKIVSVLANFLRSVGVLSPQELAMCINMSINRLGPSYEGLELGIGESLLIKALIMTTGAGNDRIKAELLRLGDLGAVAEVVRSRQQTMFKPQPLTVVHVFERLKDVANMSGHCAQTKKVKLIQSLLVACRECEAKFLIRSLQGKLRIGLAEQSVLMALGQAVATTPFHSVLAVFPSLGDNNSISPLLLNGSKSYSAEAWKSRLDEVVGHVKQAYCQCPNYERVVASLLEDGPDTVHLRCCITPGIPLRPMLAHPTHGVTEVLKRFDQSMFTCEYKYDGERAQIHLLSDGSVRVYSRNQEDNTSKYPDIVNNLVASVLEKTKITDAAGEILAKIGTVSKESVGHVVTSFIMDTEAVAWDREANQILPFQVLSTRKRKDVQEADVKVCVCVYSFDLLFLNGVALTEQPLRTRRELLRQVFLPLPGQFMFATSLDTSDTEEIARFMDESIKGNCEGLMVKTLDIGATYEIAKRSHNWLKLKKDYLEGVGDTLDLVVIGGFHGSGKRTGRYGGFLLACYNADDEEYQTICKIGTGLTDEDLEAHSNFFKSHIISSPKTYYQYTKSLVPDHWFEPIQVWEVKAADVSVSPAHKAAAGMADPEKGLSLRFPRFLRIRDDKKPEDATTSAQVYEMYCNQDQIKNTDKQDATEEDYY